MKCNFVIHTTLKGEDVTLVVTEVDYTPAQTQTYHQEGWPEMIDIIEGYVLDENDNEIDVVEELIEDKMDYIIEELLNLYGWEVH